MVELIAGCNVLPGLDVVRLGVDVDVLGKLAV